MHADLSEGHGGDPWDDAWRDIRGLGARDVLGVQGACLEVGRGEVGHVEVVRDGHLHSAQLPAAPSADEPSSQRTSAAPCGTPVSPSKAAASGAPAIKGRTSVKIQLSLMGKGGKFKSTTKALLTAHNFDLFL